MEIQEGRDNNALNGGSNEDADQAAMVKLSSLRVTAR